MPSAALVTNGSTRTSRDGWVPTRSTRCAELICRFFFFFTEVLLQYIYITSTRVPVYTTCKAMRLFFFVFFGGGVGTYLFGHRDLEDLAKDRLPGRVCVVCVVVGVCCAWRPCLVSFVNSSAVVVDEVDVRVVLCGVACRVRV